MNEQAIRPQAHSPTLFRQKSGTTIFTLIFIVFKTAVLNVCKVNTVCNFISVDEIHLINSVFRLSIILYHILIYYKRDIRKNHKKCNSNLKQFYFSVQGYRHIFRIIQQFYLHKNLLSLLLLIVS